MITMKKIVSGLLLAVIIVPFSCGYIKNMSNKAQGDGNGESITKAVADINGFAANTIKGKIYFKEEKLKGLRITGEIEGLLPDSTYAIHIHQKGDCSTPAAPGEHFDPAQTGKHGAPGQSAGQHHAGDLPNIKAGGNGKASIDFTTNLLGAGTSQFSVIGRSIVIHSRADDYTSQPSGNSGDRIACGIIQEQ